MNITARKMKPEDTTEVYKMYKELYDFLHEKGFMLKLNNEKVIKELVLKTIKLEFEHIYVALCDNEIAGFVYFSLSDLNNKFVSSYGGSVGNLIELYVKNDFRHKSIGRLLLSISENYFNKNNTKIIQVSTTYQNENTIEFYKSHGYKSDIITFTKIT